MFNKYPYLDFNNLNLDWVIKMVQELGNNVETLELWKEEHEKAYNELKRIIDNINNGVFTPEFESGIREWLNNNAESIIDSWIHNFIYFGLTDSGYFTAYIPESWSDIMFRTTGYDVELELMPEYGHLVLIY